MYPVGTTLLSLCNNEYFTKGRFYTVILSSKYGEETYAFRETIYLDGDPGWTRSFVEAKNNFKLGSINWKERLK